jgi:trehalose 6-phosphate phosphatase
MLDLSTRTTAGWAGVKAIAGDPAGALLAFDFDGTLSPIVADPDQAYALPEAIEALARLGRLVGQVAIITGRPAGQAVRLARLESDAGLEHLVILGQYGFERWSAGDGHVRTIEPPPGLSQARKEIPDILAAVGVGDALLEDKGIAIGVHVRRSADPVAAFRAIENPLAALADRTGLSAEPGRFVVELRPPGMDKGKALLSLAEEVRARSLMFTGDDLGDLAAFEAVSTWRSSGGAGLLVCSGSPEVTELAARADLVVDGPAGVVDLLHSLVSLLESGRV